MANGSIHTSDGEARHTSDEASHTVDIEPTANGACRSCDGEEEAALAPGGGPPSSFGLAAARPGRHQLYPHAVFQCEEPEAAGLCADAPSPVAESVGQPWAELPLGIPDGRLTSPVWAAELALASRSDPAVQIPRAAGWHLLPYAAGLPIDCESAESRRAGQRWFPGAFRVGRKIPIGHRVPPRKGQLGHLAKTKPTLPDQLFEAAVSRRLASEKPNQCYRE